LLLSISKVESEICGRELASRKTKELFSVETSMVVIPNFSNLNTNTNWAELNLTCNLI
jgi:hypothetical protein